MNFKTNFLHVLSYATYVLIPYKHISVLKNAFFANRISSFAQQASYFALTATKLVKYNYAERKTFYLKILSPSSIRFLIFP